MYSEVQSKLQVSKSRVFILDSHLDEWTYVFKTKV